MSGGALAADAGRLVTQSGDEAPYETGWYKWYVAGTMCAAHAVSMLDRFVMVLVSEPIRAAMGLTDTQLGLLQGTGFALLYCAFALPLGCIADAANRRRLIMCGLVFWSLATVATAFTGSFAMLFLTRILVGLGEACLIPAAMSLLVNYFAPSNLARGTAIFGIGANLGFGLAFVGGGILLSAFGSTPRVVFGIGSLQPWQAIFFAAGLSSLPVLLLLIWLKEPPREVGSGARTVAGQLAGMRRSVSHILDNLSAYHPFLIVAAMIALMGNGVNAWSSSLWVRLHDLSPSDAGKTVGLIGIFVGPLGTLAGGYALDRLNARGVVGAPLALMSVGAALMVATALGFIMARGEVLAMLTFGSFMFLSFFLLPSVYVGMQMLTPDGFRGVAASFNMMVYTLVGFGLGPTVVGAISDRLGGPEWIGVSVLLVEVGAALIILPIVYVARRRFGVRASQVRAPV